MGGTIGNTIGTIIDGINRDIYSSNATTQPDTVEEQVKRMLVRDTTPNQEVALMQERLNALGYRDQYGRCLDIDGRFGPSTEAAVNLFKDENELWNDGEYKGVVGNTTWELLFSEKAKATSTEYRTKWIQRRLNQLGYKGEDGRALKVDGDYG